MKDKSAHTPASEHRSQKRVLRDLLRNSNRAELDRWTETNRNPLRTLHMLLWDSDALIRWRAIDLIGNLTPDGDTGDLTAAREFVRKLLWSMNDESGSLCPHAPEAVAEIMYRSARLQQEFLESWLSFLDEEPFEVGMRCGVVRLCSQPLTETARQLLTGSLPALQISLCAGSADLRAASVRAIQALDGKISESIRNKLASDSETVTIYDHVSSELVTMSVADLLL